MTTTIQATELNQRLRQGERFQLIDVRSPQEFASGHIPCAVNMPMDEVIQRLDDMHEQDPVVLVCHSGKRAEMTSNVLSAHRNDLLLLEGGTSAWSNSGLPTVGGSPARLPLMRQVQLLVGPLSLVGAILAMTVDAKWAILSAVIGAGLTVAGSTGWCGMAILLAKMPWNQSKATPMSCSN